MKYFTTIFLALIVSMNYAQPCKKLFIDQLEPNSKIISCEYNSTIEKLPDGTCILKRYYPENKTITHLVTVKTDEFKVKHGLYQERYDDGTLVTSGMYDNNRKQGEWRNNTYQFGFYDNDLKEGSWKHYSADSTIVVEHQYLKGELNGVQIYYDSLGAVLHTEIYDHGKKISSTKNATLSSQEEMPRYPGCESLGLTDDNRQKCADEKLMAYIYSNLKYPMKAREQNIQGTALVRFVVEKNGSVAEIEVLNGVSKEIKKEVINLVSNMPQWRPGYQDGKPVRVLYNLPIQFRLE